MSSRAIDDWARNNAQELKFESTPLGVKIVGVECSIVEQHWLNAYYMYKAELEHGVPTPGRF